MFNNVFTSHCMEISNLSFSKIKSIFLSSQQQELIVISFLTANWGLKELPYVTGILQEKKRNRWLCVYYLLMGP